MDKVHLARFGDTEPSDGASAGRVGDPSGAGNAADGAGCVADAAADDPHGGGLSYARFAADRQWADRKRKRNCNACLVGLFGLETIEELECMYVCV